MHLESDLENKCINNLCPNKILRALIMAAVQDSAPAQYELGVLYAMGDTELGKDLNKAFQLYSQAAEKGFVAAIYAVAHCYQDGIGVEQDVTKAKQWIKKAQVLEKNQR